MLIYGMKYLALLAVFSLPCCSGAPPPRPLVVHDAPRITLQFHGDTNFTLTERALVADAVSQIEYQTAGLYRLGITYDLDFHARPDKWDGTPLLVRAESSYDWIQLFEFRTGGTILGLTMRDPINAPPQVFLIADRLEDPARFRHVAMHELLHSAGLEDLPGVESVMSGSACETAPNGRHCPLPVCMSVSDQAEFCRVAHCHLDELNPCKQGV